MKTDNMTAKEYLNQAYYLDIRINSKLEQASRLRSLATKASAHLSDMPKGVSVNKSSMENTIIKLVDLEREIDNDIDALVDIKRDIADIIKSVTVEKHSLLLELRYLCFLPWEQIAELMGCDPRSVFRLHQKALENIPDKNRKSVS